MVTGALVTPAAVAVIVVRPLNGAPEAVVPLQVTKVESQTPAQTSPPGEIVASVGFAELKLNVVVTGPPEELKAFTDNGSET